MALRFYDVAVSGHGVAPSARTRLTRLVRAPQASFHAPIVAVATEREIMALVKSSNARPRPSMRYLAPTGGVDDIFQQFESLLQPFTGRTDSGIFANPYPVDLYEDGDNVVLEMAVPGLKPDQLDISLEGRQLTIRGTLPEIDEAEGNGRRYWSRGIMRGEFQRTVTIPAGVDPERINARVDQGLLVLTMPKAAEAKARKIAIESR